MNEMFSQGGKGSTGILTNKQAVARHFGVKQSEVVYFSVGVDLGGYKVIYDKQTQRAYSLPTGITAGTLAVSLSNAAILIHSAGSVDLGELAINRQEYVVLSGDFTSGNTLNIRNEVLIHEGTKYFWNGVLPKVVPQNSTPENTGGINDDGWHRVDGSVFNELSKNSGASLIKTTNGDTVQESLNKLQTYASTTIHVQDFYSGTGFYNSAIEAALLAAESAEATEIFLGGDLSCDPTVLLDLSKSNLRYFGGTFVNAQVLVRGTIGSEIPMSTPITKWQSEFNVSNSLSPGDLVLIRNYPTNSGDAYTEGSPSLFQGGTRNYATDGPTTLRNTRRKQLFDVATATSSNFTTYPAALDAFSSPGLVYAKVNPIKNVVFDCNFKGGYLWAELTDSLAVTGVLDNTFVVSKTTIRTNMSPVSFTSTSDARIDFFEASSGFTVNTVVGGHTSSADNAIIKILGCNAFDVDVVCTGTLKLTGFAHVVMVDTEYTENPTGYSALPSGEYNIKCVASGMLNDGHAVFISTDPGKAYNSSGNITVASGTGSIGLKGCTDINVMGIASSLSIEGAQDCNLSNLKRLSGEFVTSLTTLYGTYAPTGNEGILRTGTIVVSGSTSAGTCTYSGNQCVFIKQGNVVQYSGIVTFSGHTGTGDVQLELPVEWSPKQNIADVGFAVTTNSLAMPTAVQFIPGSRALKIVKADTSNVGLVADQTIKFSGSYVADFINN